MRKYCLVFILLFLAGISFNVNAVDNYLNGNTFEEVTLKEVERRQDPILEHKSLISMDFYFIHPKTTIDYDINSDKDRVYRIFDKNYDNMIQFEEDLKQKYNIILLQLKVDGDCNEFSLYEFKNSFTLETNEKELDIIDFYDYKLSGSSHSYFDSGLGDYRSKFGSHFIYGYLLFPKVKLEETKVTLKNNYGLLLKPVELTWDLEKINKLIDVMSN